MSTEAADRVDFSQIRYAQCWEDADILLEALQVQPGDVSLSIASAGDNSFSLLTKNPAKVIAVDLNPAQLACVHLRKAAYAELSHEEFLQLLGVRPSNVRNLLYERCCERLPAEALKFFAPLTAEIEGGIAAAGKFERYFDLFRRRVLPRVHGRKRVDELLADKPLAARRQFYDQKWNTWRWRLMFNVFFSRFVMGRLGRDPAFFQYVEGSVAQRIMKRAEHALVELNPAENPYLQWILTGTFGTALPHALRPENYEAIRLNLDRLHVYHGSIEDYLAAHPDERIDRFNLSDIFEYMSADNYAKLLDVMVTQAKQGARLAYWNMLVPRSRPPEMADRLRPVEGLGETLLLRDKAFFYSRFVVETVA
ncbi:MAG TPA: DUF3419 family protein [Tepidisphaeraceae bacterium]|jgi:S-adenosylmethionine-diacylglycerol 3-amino-3-carboxypropyl transferase